jgi:autotransporter-associated beta strand protein
MNRIHWSALTLGLFSLASLLVPMHSARAAVKYWDTTGDVPGAAVDGVADGDWDLGTANWSSSAAGDVATEIWAAGDDAVFSAGSDVGTDPESAGAFITIAGTQTASSVLIEDGYVELVSGQVSTNTVTVNDGATFAVNSALRLDASSAAATGKVVLNGGTMLQTNSGNAGSFMFPLRGLEINGVGYIGYDDGGGTADNQVSIYSGVISGVGGTPTNGGAGTLIKIGPDQIGIGNTDNYAGGGIRSQELMSFAKLVVRQGAYRGRNQTSSDNAVRETIFGAVPLAVLPDAITLDGGGIGSNTTITLHANRGVTVSPNGGYFDHGAGAGLTIPGPLSGSGTLTIGSPTSTSLSNVTFTLSNSDNVNTFTGKIVGIRGVLQLNSSLTVGSLASADPAAPGGPVVGASTVSVATGQTFTFGSDNSSTSFDGNVRGAGTWRKVGTGTTTFTAAVTNNTHSGDTRIEGGTLSITSPYLANAGDIYISNGAALNLNFPDTDAIDQLFLNGTAQAVGLWGAVGNVAAQFTSSLITGAGLLQVSTGASLGLPGDFNNDLVVNAADYTVWRDNLGAADESSLNGNGDGLNGVDPGDYTLWKTNFGDTPGSGALAGASVPEPAAFVLAFVAGAFAVARRERR